MKLKRITTVLALLLFSISASITQSDASPLPGVKIKPQQILLDTGGGGGVEGSNLPGVKWWFGETPNGKPFMFWSWSPNG
jgi:hypothetical protein